DLIYLPQPLGIVGDVVVVTEGEKAADATAAGGWPAIGTVCGAAAAPGPHVIALLAQFDVVLWPDHDDVGRRHMNRLGRALEAAGVAALYVVRWPDAPEHGDAADADPETIGERIAEALGRRIGPIAA